MMRFKIILLCIFPIYLCTIISKAQTAEEFLKLAQEKFQAQEYFRVLDYVDESIKLKPKNPEAYFLKGLAEYNLQNATGAIENFNLAITYNPDYLEAYFNRGLLKAGLQKYEEAIPDFDKVLEQKAIPMVYEQRGLSYYNLQKPDIAEKDFQKALTINPKSSKSLYFLGLINFQKEIYPSAIQYLSQAITLKADYEDAYALRVEAYIITKDSLHALEDYGHLIQLNPYNWSAYLKRGKINFALGNYQEALPDFERLVNKQPDNAEAFLYLAHVLYQLHREGEACEGWKKSKSLGNREADLYIQKYCNE